MLHDVLDDVLPHAPRDTPARLRRRLRTSLARHDADAAAHRAEVAQRDRRVHLEALPDLCGDLRVRGPWAQVAWIHRVVDAWARRERERRRGADASVGAMVDVEGEPGPAKSPGGGSPPDDLGTLRLDGFTEAARLLAVSMGLASADEATDAATVGAVAARLAADGLAVAAPDGPGRRRRSWAQAVAVVPIATALGAADEPGLLPGYGPVPARVARELLASADQWRCFLTGDDGVLVRETATRYRPSTRLRELVTARDHSCVFPGCARPAIVADLDHLRNFDGANTTADNLHPLCRRHHRLKTFGAWHVTGAAGASKRAGPRWTSPAGLRYTSACDPPWPAHQRVATLRVDLSWRGAAAA